MRIDPSAKDSWLESFIAGEEFTLPSSGGVVPRPQEVEEFHPFTQAALHHFRALDHFRDDGGDLGGPEIELLIEVLDRLEDFGMTQMRIVERRNLRALLR